MQYNMLLNQAGCWYFIRRTAISLRYWRTNVFNKGQVYHLLFTVRETILLNNAIHIAQLTFIAPYIHQPQITVKLNYLISNYQKYTSQFDTNYGQKTSDKSFSIMNNWLHIIISNSL